MPDAATTEQMDELERHLVAALERRRRAVLTAVVTGHGVREMQWYARSDAEMMAAVNRRLGRLPRFPVTFFDQRDAAWSGYAGFDTPDE